MELAETEKENTEYAKLRVVSVDFLNLPGGKKAYRVALENGIEYEWSTAFLREKNLDGLRAGSCLEVCGRRGNSKADLWGTTLKDVRLMRETVLLRITYCRVIIRPRDGVKIFVIELENGAGFTWSEKHLQERGLPELKAGDTLEVSGKTGNTAADFFGWNSLHSVRYASVE